VPGRAYFISWTASGTRQQIELATRIAKSFTRESIATVLWQAGLKARRYEPRRYEPRRYAAASRFSGRTRREARRPNSRTVRSADV
jgi:hypothetical protein